jgi:hypothetical protein
MRLAVRVERGTQPREERAARADDELSHALGIVDVIVTSADGASAVIAADHYNYDTLPVTLQSFGVE